MKFVLVLLMLAMLLIISGSFGTLNHVVDLQKRVEHLERGLAVEKDKRIQVERFALALAEHIEKLEQNADPNHPPAKVIAQIGATDPAAGWD